MIKLSAIGTPERLCVTVCGISLSRPVNQGSVQDDEAAEQSGRRNQETKSHCSGERIQRDHATKVIDNPACVGVEAVEESADVNQSPLPFVGEPTGGAAVSLPP